LNRELRQNWPNVLQLVPDCGNPLVRPKRVTKIQFCQKPAMTQKLLTIRELILWVNCLLKYDVFVFIFN